MRELRCARTRGRVETGRLVLYWLVFGLPLMCGVIRTVQTALPLFG